MCTLSPRILDLKADEFLRYFTKFEKYSPSQDFPDVDVTLRGAQGLVEGALNSYSRSNSDSDGDCSRIPWSLCKEHRCIHQGFAQRWHS